MCAVPLRQAHPFGRLHVVLSLISGPILSEREAVQPVYPSAVDVHHATWVLQPPPFAMYMPHLSTLLTAVLAS